MVTIDELVKDIVNQFCIDNDLYLNDDEKIEFENKILEGYQLYNYRLIQRN